MDFTISRIFDRNELPESPPIILRHEFIKLAVSSLDYSGSLVSLRFHVTYMFPRSLTLRYNEVSESMVLVVEDIDRNDRFSSNFAMNVFSDSDSGAGDQLIPPPMDLPGPGSKELEVLDGGWVNGELSFTSPDPRSRPGVFMHVELEYYISNRVGLDLFDKTVVYL